MNAIRNWFDQPMTEGEIAGSIMIADSFAMGFGSIIATAVLFTAVVWVFSFFGHPLGIAG